MRKLTFLVASVFVVISSGIVFTDDGGSRSYRLRLRGLDEVPAISTIGRGTFRATINHDETEITWRLSYVDLEGQVLQSHIHFGPPNWVNSGNISVFLCSNLANPPAGTKLCPVPSGSVEDVITAEDVIGPAAQGIEPGALAELIAAIKDGKAYVNVHSTKWTGGEIRKNFPGDNDHGDHR